MYPSSRFVLRKTTHLSHDPIPFVFPSVEFSTCHQEHFVPMRLFSYLYLSLRVVLMVGFEPTTTEFRVPCSTAELHKHKMVRAVGIEPTLEFPPLLKRQLDSHYLTHAF